MPHGDWANGPGLPAPVPRWAGVRAARAPASQPGLSDRSQAATPAASPARPVHAAASRPRLGRRPRPALLVGGVGLILALACLGVFTRLWVGATPAHDGAVADEALLATAPETAATGAEGSLAFVLRDDFSDPDSGWPTQSSDPSRRRVGYVAGEYEIVKVAGGPEAPFVRGADEFGDFRYEIDLRLVAPTTDAYGFLDFRRQTDGRHYSFVVDPNDGTFLLEREEPGGRTPLVPWTRSPAIQRGAATNRLAVEARGREMALFINDSEVARLSDDALAEGTIAFGVGSYGGGRAEGRFDNLLVQPLPPS